MLQVLMAAATHGISRQSFACSRAAISDQQFRLILPQTASRSTELTALPWVNHASRTWEPEPLRWLGVRGLYTAYKLADRHEAGGRTTNSPIAALADRITGRP